MFIVYCLKQVQCDCNGFVCFFIAIMLGHTSLGGLVVSARADTISTCQGCVSTESSFQFVPVLTETGPQFRDLKGGWNSAGSILDFPLPLDE